MKATVKVIDIFKTSIGEVSVLAFFDEERPSIGMVLKNESNLEWVISGIGGNRKLGPSNKYADYDAESVWDCVLKPVGHLEAIKTSDNFELR